MTSSISGNYINKCVATIEANEAVASLKILYFTKKRVFIMTQINFSQFSVTIWFKFDILS